MSAKLLRYIKTKTGEKTEMRTTSFHYIVEELKATIQRDLNNKETK